MATQQLYRRDLKPGDTYGASLNDATPTFRVDEDGDTIDLRNGAVRYHGLSTMVHHVIRAATPSTPPAPVRKGRVGMRVRHGATGREVVLTSSIYDGYWDTIVDGKAVEGLVRDGAIGDAWRVLPDATADTRAAAVEPGSRVQLSECHVGDVVDEIEGVEELTCQIVSTFLGGAYMTVLRHPSPREVGTERRFIGLARLVSRDAAAPVATPEVVRAGVRLSHCRVGDVVHNARNEAGSASHIFEYGAATIMSIGAGRVDFALSGRPFYTEYAERYVVDVVSTAAPAPAPTALRRYEGAQQAEAVQSMRDADRREGSAAFTAAVSLRLAARAEAKRVNEQQHCQPNWAGGDDVDE
jgi:hypothetical protein